MTSLSKRNYSIDIFRYLCAILVVAIHTRPFGEISNVFSYIIIEILPRIAVPFFFCVSGFFYIKKLEEGKTPFLRYMKRLLLTYTIWSVIYFALIYVISGGGDTLFLIQCIKNFFIFGSYYHLWFFPALIFSVCFTTFLWKLKAKKFLISLSFVLYLFGCLGCSYYQIAVKIPFLNKFLTFSHFTAIRRIFLMGFPFFISGYLVNRLNNDIFAKFSKIQMLACLLVSFLIWIAEIVLVVLFNLQENIVLTLGLYPLLICVFSYLLNNNCAKMESLGKKALPLANFTYYAHPLFMTIINWAIIKIFGFSCVNTLLFILTVISTFICGFIIYKWNNKLINYFIK